MLGILPEAERTLHQLICCKMELMLFPPCRLADGPAHKCWRGAVNPLMDVGWEPCSPGEALPAMPGRFPIISCLIALPG